MRRSSSAPVSRSEPNTSVHSSKGRLVVTRLETLTDRAFLRRFISPPAGETTTDTRHLPVPATWLISPPISRLSGEDMTPDSRPVSLDALSAEDGSAVALAVTQAASENTRRAYRQQWAAFTTWASAQGYPSLPALDATLAAYLTLLAGQGFALASVRQARGAVVKAHELAGSPTPAGPVTAAALRGIGRSIGAGQGQAAPLTAEGLAAIRATAPTAPGQVGGCPETAGFARHRGQVDVAIASVIRDGLLRVSEDGGPGLGRLISGTGRLRHCHRPAVKD